jgi:hypothetical protein
MGEAGTKKVEQQLQDVGDNMIWVEAGSRARNGIRLGARGTKSLIEADAKAVLEQVPLIKSAAMNVDGRVQIVYGNNNWNTTYRGVTPSISRSGNGISRPAMRSRRPKSITPPRSVSWAKRSWTIFLRTRAPWARSSA